ncbi:MAG: sigma-70 family RNA polymerase sigma factor [Planctomycetes bacterium]|nr:sigma-70 family RNA polymerase sigma factor [Planctomycetota bacterium]
MSRDDNPTILRTITNTQLLDDLRNPGNETVWQQFVNRYMPMIVKYAVRAGLRSADAEDAAQQTMIAFCTAYQQGKYDREKGRLRFWLYGIARNQIKSVFKRRAKQEVQVAEDTAQTDFFARQPDEADLEKVWEEEWREAVLRQCLEEVHREFDAKSIEAFELFAWKGLPAQEVAERLDMTPNAVFIVKSRILKRIRELVPDMEKIW